MMFVKGIRVTWSRSEVTALGSGLFLIGTLADTVNDDPGTGDYVAPTTISSWDPARAMRLGDEVDWWAGARLCLGGETVEEASEELGFGTLVDTVDMAMSRPRRERPRLSIRMEMSEVELSWDDISRLAQRPDKPMMI